MNTLGTADDLSLEQQEWLAIRDTHIAHLEATLSETRATVDALQRQLHQYTSNTSTESQSAELEAAQLNAARVQKDLYTVRQEHLAYVSAYQQRTGELQEEVNRWQHDYEDLRIQKGGFGFKSMAMAVFGGVVAGLLAFWLFFATRDPHEVVFDRFRTAAGFQVEYALRQRQFEQAEKLLKEQEAIASNGAIVQEITWIKDLIQATKMGFAEANISTSSVEGYAVKPQIDTNGIPTTPLRTLVVTEAVAHLHAEALPESPVLAEVKKKDRIGQWDRTPETSKVKTKFNTYTGTAEDYWYEVETTDGTKGWVFGFFTNASLKRFKPDKIDSTLLKSPILPISIKKDSVQAKPGG